MIRSLFHTSLVIATCGILHAQTDAGGSFVETTKSYRPADISEVRSLVSQQQNSYAWQGERINWQILLWSGDKPVQVSASASELVSDDGKRLPAKQVRLDFLKFIAMNTQDRYATDPALVAQVPDLLNGPGPVTLGADQLQPLWVAVEIPRGAKPGVYRGKVSVKLDNQSLEFPFAIKVLPLTIPEVKDWTLDINFWMHPQATAHYYAGCKCHGQDPSAWVHKECADLMWSDQHLAWYRPTLELLRDAGQKSITTNLVKDPWRSAYQLKSEQAQTNYSYDEMVHWRRKADGTFTFDFRDFEKFVKFCMDVGIDQQIECFSMLPWIASKSSAVTCIDETSGKEVIHYFKDWDEYHRVWSTFMAEFVPMLVKNGWFERTIIGADERGLANMGHVQKVLEKFKHRGKPLKISSAANQTHSFDDQIHSISMQGGRSGLANNHWSESQYADWADTRRSKGLVSTWYTCTGTYPGNFGNSRPAESSFIGWYSARIKADGYLRWAVDSWNDNPTETTDHKVYETGDTFQIYPGDRDAKVPFTRSSVRFELFRKGVVDYEKIQVLKAKFPGSSTEIDEILAKVVRPTPPPAIPGNSSLNYTKDTEEDFANITNTADKELLELTLKLLK